MVTAGTAVTLDASGTGYWAAVICCRGVAVTVVTALQRYHVPPKPSQQGTHSLLVSLVARPTVTAVTRTPLLLRGRPPQRHASHKGRALSSGLPTGRPCVLVRSRSLLILGWGTKENDFRIGLDIISSCLVGCGYSHNRHTAFRNSVEPEKAYRASLHKAFASYRTGALGSSPYFGTLSGLSASCSRTVGPVQPLCK